ncbi:MAG: hypothetical protein AAF533_23440 [Acidobacteriota bacterium]
MTLRRFLGLVTRVVLYGSLLTALGAVLVWRHQSEQLARRSLAPLADGLVALIPFEITDGHVHCALRVDGQTTGGFIFDTCAAASSVDPQWAREAGFGSTMSGSLAHSPAGVTFIYQWRAPDFFVGSLPVRSHLVGENISGLGRGLIGYELFSDKCLVFDWTASRIEARNDCGRSHWDFEPVRVEGGVPQVQVRLPSGRLTWFFLDTGCQPPLVLARRLLDEIPDHRRIGHGTAEVTGGQLDFLLYEVSGLELLGRRHDDVEASVVANTVRDGLLGEHDGVIGLPLIRQQDLALDGPGSRLGRPPVR